MEYHLQTGIFSEYNEHEIIKGNIKFTIQNDKADFIFEGELIKLAVNGYEIIDYPK